MAHGQHVVGAVLGQHIRKNMLQNAENPAPDLFLRFFHLIPMSKSLKVYFTTAFLRHPLHMSSFKRPWASQNALALVRRIDSSESCGLLSGKSSVCTEVKPRSKPQRRYVRGAWLEPRSLSFPRNIRNKLRWLTKSHPAN